MALSCHAICIGTISELYLFQAKRKGNINKSCIQDGLGQITHERPYNQIDDTTDITKEQIIIHKHGGAFHWEEEYYSKKDGRYVLQQIVRREEDTLYTFRPMELIDKKRILQT